MAPPWSVWWRFNVTSEALTMRKGQAWPKCCTPARWRCWVKRVCAANTSWSLQDPATPERMIHHLACSLMLKYRGENPDSARPVLVMPPLTCEALPEVCFHLSQGTLQSATAKDDTFPAPLPHATKGWLSSPASCSALTTLRLIHLGELKKSCEALSGYQHCVLLISFRWTMPIACWAWAWADKWLQMNIWIESILYYWTQICFQWKKIKDKKTKEGWDKGKRLPLAGEGRLSSDWCFHKTANLISTTTFATLFPQWF